VRQKPDETSPRWASGVTIDKQWLVTVTEAESTVGRQESTQVLNRKFIRTSTVQLKLYWGT